MVENIKERVQDELLEHAARLRPEEAAMRALLLKRRSREARQVAWSGREIEPYPRVARPSSPARSCWASGRWSITA